MEKIYRGPMFPMSVTQRIGFIKQPYGGYIKPSDMQVTYYKNKELLHENEVVHSSLMGLAVDYLTRFSIYQNKVEVFRISLNGALQINDLENAADLLDEIEGLDYQSIENAIRLCGYDVIFRTGLRYYVPVNEIEIDKNSVDNVRIMVRRTLDFLDQEKKIVQYGFTFKGGYTDCIATGDGDVLTEDTLWDFKVSKSKPNSKQTLQILVYYLMGLHSIHDYFKNVKYIGIYNPRLNCSYKLAIDSIDNNVISEVEKEVIGYD